MVVINSDKFSPSDLALFVESLEQISRIKCLKKQRKERILAHCSPNTLDQQHNNESNAALISCDKPEEEDIHDNTTCLMEDQYYIVNSTDDLNKDQDGSLSCYSPLYSTPHSCSESDECAYETIKHYDDADYDEIDQGMRRNKAKRKLSFLGFVCKKYKKCFSGSSNTNYCLKSDSWTQLTLV